mmetsp:Transcript_1807/g.4083  ORF Transcript_1807/g.4083 Transcript_1807/m.4083 type:complete len:124 (+) Transcript_1807:659-1030(+)
MRSGKQHAKAVWVTAQHHIASTLMAMNPRARPQQPVSLCFSSAKARGKSSMLETWRNVPLDRAMQTALTMLRWAAVPKLDEMTPMTTPSGVPAENMSTKHQNVRLLIWDCEREHPRANAARPL